MNNREGMTLEFKWTVSRGRDTYGYNICSLFVDGVKRAACNGGGYDMEGTSLGNWMQKEFKEELLALRPEDMPKQSHWERAEKPGRYCAECITNDAIDGKEETKLPNDAETCPKCGGETRIDHNEGKTVDQGRYFYGLSFHNPNYDPGKAVVGKDCTDRTLGAGAEGKTVAEAEKAGESFGLERYQAFYSASSKHPTKEHVIPLIDGACGKSSVQAILRAVGYELEYIPTRSKNNSIYKLRALSRQEA